MSLVSLDISHFRNISYQQLQLIPGINVICGPNGSGKTSILEAIFLLTHGKSFRSRRIDRIVQHEKESLCVLGKLSQDNEQVLQIAIEKGCNGDSKLKVANDFINTTAELTKLYPLLVINPDSYKILESGPKHRRQFLDWGLFHVEPQFFTLWKRYNRTLKQRNSGLKQHMPKSLIQSWDQELISLADGIDQLRTRYIDAFQPIFFDILAQFIHIEEITLHYQRGWSQKHSFAEVLEQSFSRDHETGFTHSGPHRGDLLIKVGGVQAHEVLSRGQQKLVIVALRLAQGLLLREFTQKSCGYLIDDLPAELDAVHQQKVAEYLKHLQSQVIVTGVDERLFQGLLGTDPYKMFHVEHGKITLMSS